ncbi:phage/plasmid replication domain-containing protein [Pseudomonas alloputida]|uniref:phage/plasmid replication domain-containing protein n=1 Tax=Pseudomonas TaxID=286 RepID=UPI003EECDD88
MFIDWLTVSQEHQHDLPIVGHVMCLTVDVTTDEVLSTKSPRFVHRESYSTSVTIHVSGRNVRVDGNPSRVGRLDNLFGFATIDQCISVYNALLAQYGLPPFTRCSEVLLRDGASGGKAGDLVADGAVIHRIDLTSNVAVGEGNALAYLRGVSSQRIEHSIGFLYPNGRTVAWTPKGNGKGGRLQYRKAYDKAFEMDQNLLPKIKREFGENSDEFKYVVQVRDYCAANGVVRMEQELKAEFLKRKGLAYWGLFKEARFIEIHKEFLAIDERMKVTAMDMMTIADKLLEEQVVSSRQSANATAAQAMLWMHGSAHGLSKRAFETHAARLNQIGINIRNACDTSRFAPVFVRQCREVTKAALPIPTWYRRPNHLQQVAA